MHDFLGTFNRSMFERLASYLRDQVPQVQARTSYLVLELSRVGTLTMLKDIKGRPLGYAASSPDSYLGQLLAAYEILGGNPFFDLRVRSMTEPVYLLKGDEAHTPKFFSNGEPTPETALADAPSANIVLALRSFSREALARMDLLERKIRRTLDYGDQLQAEITLLEKMVGDVEAEGSLENLISQVSALFQDKTYRAIADDGGKDPYGQYIRAKFAAYDPGPRRPEHGGEGVERTGDGYYVFGESGESSSTDGSV